MNAPVRRRQLLRVLPAAALWCASGDAARAQHVGQARITVAVGGRGLLCYLPLLLAEQLGYFRDEGLSVSIKDHVGGSQALQSVLRGESDVCAGAYEHVLTHSLKAGSGSLKTFTLLTRAPQLALGVSAKGLPKYRSMQDLRGRRIGVSALGSYSQSIAETLLARAGIAAEDVTFVPVGSGIGALQAVRTGLVHALCHADPLITVLEQRAECKVVADLRSLKATQEAFGGPVPTGCLYASQAFLQAHAEKTRALTHAVVHALKWLQTAAPSDLVKAIPQDYWMGDRGAYLAAFSKVRETFSPHGAMPEEGPAVALRALQAMRPELAGTRLDLGKTFTNDWVKKARSRYGL